MKKKLFVLGLLLPLLAIGCSTSNSSSSNDSSTSSSSSSRSTTSSQEPSSSEVPINSSEAGPVHVKSVSLNKSSVVFYQDDPAITLTATVLPANAENKNVIWSSNNTNVATVSDGVVTPVSPGEATITVKTIDGNKSTTCKVSVAFPNYVIHGKFKGESEWTDKPMINNDKSTAEYMLLDVQLYKDDVFTIHMYGDTWYGYSHLKSSVRSGLVTKASTNNDIKVLETGVYDIYCSYNESDGGHIYLDNTGYTPSPGTVHVTDIQLNRSGKYLQYRHEYQLTANIYPSTASEKKVVWTSSDESVATVTSSGRVVAKEKTGSTTITATTYDQHKVDTCLIYVSAYPTPEYYLVGTIGGRSYSAGTYTYAALPLGSKQFLIPNVDFVKGDKVKVMDRHGGYLHSTSEIGNPVYEYSVSESKSVNLYLDTSKTKDYLSAVNRASRDIYVKYDADTNADNKCGWIYVQGPDITPYWLKSSSEMSGSRGCRFNISKHATEFTFARAPRNQEPDADYTSLTLKTRVKSFDITDDVYEYDATVDSE
ncbi:MAG: hypothetical protein E7181_02630 [Erysipelotrichaceae bacterium]|nr:hypothetical protein [Erysipelotrichaceae bacterium]